MNEDDNVDKDHWRHVALAWTIAAAIATTYCYWPGSAHSKSMAQLSWLMTVCWWAVVIYENYKDKQKPRE